MKFPFLYLVSTRLLVSLVVGLVPINTLATNCGDATTAAPPN